MLGSGQLKKAKGFGLIETIVIIIVTAIVSSITTGVIMLNSSSTIDRENVKNIADDENLMNFINIYETLKNRYFDEIDTEGMLKAAEEGMLDFLGDKYTTYLEDNEYTSLIDELSSTYSGIGILIDSSKKIIGVTNNSPAEKVGLEVQDLILKINNEDVTTKTAEEVKEIIKNSSKIINLTINRNDVELSFDVEKTQLANITISSKKIENTQIGYLKIEKFSENLDEQVKEALEDLEKNGINSLIIDVRDNVGGYLLAAENTASLFLKQGKVIYSLETNDNKIIYKDKTKEKRDYEIVVLINSKSASASEILASALKESYGATLVGNKTYGKGKVQQIVGTSAKYTFAKWLTPNGNCIDGIGILPDYDVSNTIEDSIDHQLNKAIELLSN